LEVTVTRKELEMDALHRTLCIVMLALLSAAAGCRRSSKSNDSTFLVLQEFNQAGAVSVAVNQPLEFVFNISVEPLTVDTTTIQIWRMDGSQRVDAPGAFEVVERTVTWYPQATNELYPLDTAGNPNTPMLPGDQGLNTASTGSYQYQVLIPGFPNPVTVRSPKGRQLPADYASSFTTAPGPAAFVPGESQTVTRLFSANVKFYRDTVRVGDVLAYSGQAYPIQQGFIGWMSSPISSGGENPLFIDPSLVTQAQSDWIGRSRTGFQVESNLRIRLVPPMTVSDMSGNAFPSGVPHSDERYVSNWQGAKEGRTVEVEGIVVPFTQPIATDSFLDPPLSGTPKPYQTSPIQIRVTPFPTPVPWGFPPEPYTMTFVNDTDTQSARVSITLQRVIQRGWIHVSVDPRGVLAMPGGRFLEENLLNAFIYIWPVEINAR